MGPVLVDLRGLQGATEDSAVVLLSEARTSLSGRNVIGLVDPARPALSDAAAACVDTVCADPGAARRTRPECFVRLAPCDDDVQFTASLLLDPAIPSVALASAPAVGLAGAVRRYWQSRVDVIASPATIWASASALRRSGSSASIAVLSATPDLPLCRAMGRIGADVFGPAIIAALSPHYDRTLVVLANSTKSAPLLRLLRRHGGAALVLDSCLLAAYDDAAATELAERELARPVPQAELLQWRAGIARPEALLLGEVAAAADPLFVHSTWLAAEIGRRYGRAAEVVPPVPDLPRIRAEASGLQAESCVWAVEMLRFWGWEVRLELACPAVERGPLRALATRLGVGDLVGFDPGPACLALVLAMRGQESQAEPLAASAGLRRIVSRGVSEGMDVAVDSIIVPDQASPPVLAEAIAALLPAPAPPEAALRIAASLGP